MHIFGQFPSFKIPVKDIDIAEANEQQRGAEIVKQLNDYM